MQETSYHLGVVVPRGYGPRWEREEPQGDGYVPYSSGEYELIARTSSSLKLAPLCCYWPAPVPHPVCTLRKPGGCEGCLAILTEFLPTASPAEKARVTGFNFDCITRWTPCADEQDILPQAGADFARESKARQAQNQRMDSCTIQPPS